MTGPRRMYSPPRSRALTRAFTAVVPDNTGMAEDASLELSRGVHRMRDQARGWFSRACVRLEPGGWSEPEEKVDPPDFVWWVWRGAGGRVLTVVISDCSVGVSALNEETGAAAGTGAIDSTMAALDAWRWLQGKQERVTLDDDAG